MNEPPNREKQDKFYKWWLSLTEEERIQLLKEMEEKSKELQQHYQPR